MKTVVPQSFRSFLPFLDDNPYPTVKEHVKETISGKQSMLKGVTAQEVCADLPYGIQTVTARINELRDEGKVYVHNKRECSEMSHSKDVNSYRVRWTHQ